MDSDDAILSSALGTSASGRVDSDTQPAAANQLNSAAADHSRQHVNGASQGIPNGDVVMQDVQDAVQSSAGGQESDMLGRDSTLSVPSTANATQQSEDLTQSDKDVAQLGFALQFVVQGLRNGAGSTLMPLLVQLLPYLMKTQVGCLIIFDQSMTFGALGAVRLSMY